LRKAKGWTFFETQCITVSEIERDIGENNGRKAGFFIPLCIRRPLQGGFRLNIGTPLVQKYCRYPMVKKFRTYVYSFWRDSRTWRIDGQTDGRTDTAWQQRPRLCVASRGKNRKCVTSHALIGRRLSVPRSTCFVLCTRVIGKGTLWFSGSS